MGPREQGCFSVRLVLIVVVTRAKTVILVGREAEDIAVEPVQLFLQTLLMHRITIVSTEQVVRPIIDRSSLELVGQTRERCLFLPPIG